jgi:hypothetical protein
MPHPQLDRKQRNALFSLILLELSHMEDLAIAIENCDESKARQHRQQLEDYFRLLDDLGWQNPIDQEAFTLTMDQTRLRRALHALSEQAIEVIKFDVEELRFTAERQSDDAALALSTTVTLLATTGQ